VRSPAILSRSWEAQLVQRTARSALAAGLLALAACAGPAPVPPAAEAPTPPPALAAGERAWRTGDGNAMPYSVAGDGAVTVLLVHCWMGDRSFWSAQLPELARLYRTVAIDLPGHGQAGASREAWTVAAYGEDVAGLILGLGLSRVVLVGHSMGGPVALRAAALAPGRVLGIVALDTLHDAEMDFSGPRIEELIGAFAADFAGTCTRFVRQMLPEPGVEAILGHVLESSCRPERAVIGVSLMRSFGAIDMPRWFAEARVPIRAINAAGGSPTRIETNRKYADFDAVTVPDVGHYLHMTRPAEVNPLLLEAIAGIAGPGA
jgi:pimeloyl-ACP methyl ester carboxylesterase